MRVSLSCSRSVFFAGYTEPAKSVGGSEEVSVIAPRSRSTSSSSRSQSEPASQPASLEKLSRFYDFWLQQVSLLLLFFPSAPAPAAAAAAALLLVLMLLLLALPSMLVGFLSASQPANSRSGEETRKCIERKMLVAKSLRLY